MRHWYRVRVREQVGPGKWVKKSKFYFTQGPGDAASKYKGKGLIMWVEKAKKDQLRGVGNFFTLGEELLKEFRRGDQTLVQEIEQKKNKKRGYYGKQYKEATNRSR